MQWRSDTAALRTAVTALCLALTLLSQGRVSNLPWFGVVALGAVIAWALSRHPTGVLVGTSVETAVDVVAVLLTGSAHSPLLASLLGPAYAAGRARGPAAACLPVGAGLLSLVAGGLVGDHGDDYAGAAATWITLSVAAAAWGSVVRQSRQRSVGGPTAQAAPYAAAYRLLAQLRPVARRLSVGLEPATIADSLLESLREVMPFDRGAVFVRTASRRLVPLAVLGAPRIQWSVTVDGDTPFGEAWLTQRRRRLAVQHDGSPGSGLVIPLVIGVRTFGLIGLESATPRALEAGDDVARDLVADAAVRLETALLFDEVRDLATAEERRRLAREIHDGIAQEISSLGYLIDDLQVHHADDPAATQESLRAVRGEITRLVGELRMSIFDLRSEVDTHGGLGAALSEYVRSVGRQSGLTVHLSLTEAADRLPAETEAELLRIAQEAVTNSRKHAGADNIWVTLHVDPPAASLRVEDDGRGLGAPRKDSFGLAIMQERAARLRTTLSVRPRTPRGTLVEVQLPAASHRRARSPDRLARHASPDRPDGVEELFR